MNKNNYGFEFNDIQIIENKFIKTAKNSLGVLKINNEINFYLHIIENNINFPMPTLLNYDTKSLTLNYIKDSIILTKIININNINEYIKILSVYLNNIHQIKMVIEPDTLKNDLNIELYEKIITRFNKFNWDSNELYKSIKYVNGLEIKNIFYYLDIIKKQVMYNMKNRNYYNLIHGDIHLGNILIDNNKLYFIDPRGYFGNSKLFGLYEYDYAKLLFGISGYSIFDNMDIEELDIKDNNITINFIKDYEYIFNYDVTIFNETVILLCLSIWLGNNSCFLDINKKITSLMIALYYCEKYIKI